MGMYIKLFEGDFTGRISTEVVTGNGKLRNVALTESFTL